MQETASVNTRRSQDLHSYRILAWVIWFLAAMFYFYENVLQVSPGVMVPDLMKAFSINSAALGSLTAFFFYSYAGMQIPVGVLVDNYDARFLLTMATLSCAIGCVLFGLTNNLHIAAVGRLLIGFGAAFAAVCSMKLSSNWFSSKHFSLLVGLLITIGMLGSMAGETPLAILVESIGWQHSLNILAISGIVLAVIIFIVVRHSPEHMHFTGLKRLHKHNKHAAPLLHGLLQVIKCEQSWILAIYGGLVYASTSIFGGLWGVPFLTKAYSLSRPEAAGIITIMFFGWVIGAPLSGVLVNLLNSSKKVLWISSIGSLVTIIIVLYVNNLPIYLLWVMIFAFGFFSSCFLPSFSLINDLHNNGNSGAALGFMNTANMLGGAIGQPLIGRLLDMSWDHTLINGVRIYSVQNYQYSLSFMPAIIAASLLLIPFIKEKK